MKKILILALLIKPLFGMNQKSVSDRSYLKIQGSYNPEIGFFKTKECNALSNNQPLQNITATVDSAPSHNLYTQKRIMSFGFERPYKASFEEIFNTLNLSEIRLFLNDFKRVPATTYSLVNEELIKTKDESKMLWVSKANVVCPVAIIEYL